MTIHRASCEDCPWSREDEDLVSVSDAMERHARKEQHDVDLQRAVATDGGFRQGDRVKVLEDSNSPKAGEIGKVRRQEGEHVVVTFDDGDEFGHAAAELVLEKQVRTDGGQEVIDGITHHCDICDTDFDSIEELIKHDCEDDRAEDAVMTDGGVPTEDELDSGQEAFLEHEASGAVDHDFDDAELPPEEQIGVGDSMQTEPMQGGIAFDLVKRQPLFVVRKKADTLAEFFDDEDFDLLSYSVHPYLPVRADDAVYECVFLSDIDVDRLDGWDDTKTYDYPRGRLAHVPIEQAWGGGPGGD